MMFRTVLLASFFAAIYLHDLVHAVPSSDFVFEDDVDDYGLNDQPYGNAKNSYKSSYKTINKFSSRSKDINFEGGCTSMPDGPLNGNLTCHSIEGCRAKCYNGYRYPNGETEFAIVCRNGIWKIQGSSYSTVPHCEPVCLPECKNNGICIEPNRCDCPENFSGPQCQFENKPCLNLPPMVTGAKTSCNTKTCTITCYKNHLFPDGSAVANMICKHGSWEPTKNDWVSIPDCQPICHPPCANGGVCLALDKCQCPKDFRGPQCQYHADVCSGEKLGFNGGFQCNTVDEDSYACTLTCPQGAPFEYPPASSYVCRYETGIFEPQPIPQCQPPHGANIVSLGSFEKTSYITHTLNTSWEFESSGFKAKDANSVGYSKNSGLIIAGSGVEGNSLEGGNSLIFSGGGSGYERVEKKIEAGACFTWAGVHYKTFDGHVFSFDSSCSYTLLKDTRDGLFTVAVQNDPLCQNVTCPRVVRIFVQGKEYDLASNPTTGLPELRNGKKVLAVPSQLPHLRVEAESGQFLSASLDAVGLKIKWDGQKLVQLEASEALWNRTAGLCGNSNGERQDDYGFGAKSPLHAAGMWKIENIGEKCEEYPSQQNPCGADTRLEKEASEFCTKLLSDSRYSSCANLVDLDGFHSACKWDYCSCNNVDPKKCACETMGVYVRQCAHKGLVALTGWRDDSVCPMECNNGRIYMACGPKTQQFCGVDFSSRFAEDDTDFDRCEEGCYCPVGTVLHQGRCIEPAECPCRLRGKSFEPGATVPKDCNTCVCVAGQWTCTETKCSARCSAVGDPHYTTFDGKRYDFMGKCSYYLVKGDGYSIEAENTPCTSSISEMMGFARSYQDGDPSCTKTVTIRVNDVAIKLKQDRQILVNGEDVTKLPMLAGDTRVRIVSSIFIAVELSNGLQVLWDGVSRVYVNAPPQFRGNTKGLCGTFTSNQKDDFLTPDGDVEQAVVAFANKWKTNEHCADIKKDSDHPCDVNAHKRDAAEKYCSVLKKKIFLGCHWHVDPEPFYKDCLYDMCACEADVETCLCPTLAAYAKDCAHLGVIVPWRQEVQECRVHCAGDQEYQTCGSSCTRSCADISFHHECKEECVEGCNCPKGLTLDVNGDCIPISQCPCNYGGLEFLAGYREIRPGTKGQELCTCASGIWNCNPATPDEVSDYPAMAQLKSLCSATKHQEITTCEPVEQRTCRNMHKHVSQTPAICRPGCICKPGYVLDPPSGECVPENQCPCYHGGRSYKEGMVRQKECNTCTCTQGGWNCTDIRCPGVCSVWGDSHYKTFDDKLFDFQGACEYVLAKGKLSDDEGFDVTVRNVPCGTTGVTCSKSLTLTVGKNNYAPEEKVTLTRGKTFTAEQFKNLQRIAVRRAGLFIFLDVPDLGLVVQWDEGTRVYVRLNAKWKGRTKGLCGDFNDNSEDDFKTPSGGLAEASASLFGDSWKMSELCAEPNDKAPDTCGQRPERKLWAIQKCRVMKSALFEPCHSEISPEDYIDRCVYDACGCDEGGDCECLCTAIAAYAQECNAMGVPIHWRSQKLCPMQCDETCSNYSPCVTTCPHETCDNMVTLGDSLHLCNQDTCIEGCQPKVCPDGHIYVNSSYSECIPRADCKPLCSVIDGVKFYEGDKVKGDDCHSCFCSRGKVVCKGVPCVKTTEIVTEATTKAAIWMGDSGKKCVSGWTKWLNRDKPKDGGMRSDIEETPTLFELLNMEETAFCDRDKMVDIKCRTVDTKLSYKETGLNVDCSLDTGLVCKPSKRPKQTCPDFEISVLCQCEEATTTTTPAPIMDTCQLSEPYKASSENCHDFYQCGPSAKGANEWVWKTCGPDMMFHEKLQICDWPANVAVSRPECGGTIEITPLNIEMSGATDKLVFVPEKGESKNVNMISGCKPDEHWDDCAVKCSQSCDYYKRVLMSNGLCNRTIDCVPACVPNSRIDCPSDSYYWRDPLTCVDRSHCTCMSDSGELVPPSQVIKETECKSCQCINNYYTCDESVCQKVQRGGIKQTKQLREFEFQNVMLVPNVVSPPQDCPHENYVWLTEQFPFDVSFGASSFASSFIGEDSIRLRRSASVLTWRPAPDDPQPWVEIQLEKPQPIYGVIVGGDAFEDLFVTSYYVIFSEDGRTFSAIGSGKPEAFRGPAESEVPVQQIFQTAIEAKVVRIYPVTWHKGIAMQVELIACGVEEMTTAAPMLPTPYIMETAIQPICDDPMGYDNRLMSGRQVLVTSTYNNQQPDLRLSSPEAWHPLLDNPDQYVQFYFLEPRNITGIETKGGDGTWVTRYNVQYSRDGLGWSPVIDDFGAVKEFLGNVDDYSSKINYFKIPIAAKLLRIYPTKWHDHIGMRVEIRGCFVPYPSMIEETAREDIPKSECNVCPGIDVMNGCMCEGSLWWDGRFCVNMQECPCMHNGISYSVGANYETSDCQICTCAMSGLPLCQPKTCPPCPSPEQRPVLSELCTCLCKNCPAGQRLCPTNDLCVDESRWCDGVNDCPDDEKDCQTLEIQSNANVTKQTIIKVECITTCPPGFVLEQNNMQETNLANFSFTMKQTESTHQSTTMKWKVPPPRFDTRFGGEEEEEENICPKIICKPEVDKSNYVEVCQKLTCPEGFQPMYDPTKSIRKTMVCDNTCVPIPPKERVCSAIGRSFTTFDGLEYKYDVCNHILARDLDTNKWYIVVQEMCKDQNLVCQKSLSITFDDHTVILQPNMYVMVDGHMYNPSEVKRLSDKHPAMKISRVGNALRLDSRRYPFWALLDASGTIKIGVSEELANHVDGMCGYLDGLMINDQQTPKGKIAKSTQEFGDSWQLLDSAECKLQVCPKEAQLQAWKMCTLVREASFDACSNVLNREKFVSSCLENSCACLSNANSTAQECRCNALASYVSMCMAADSSIDLASWRSIYDCPAMCEAPFVHKDCFRHKCEMSCENLLQPDPCPHVDGLCMQGCFCPDGMVRHGDTCVPPAECRDCVCDGLGNSRYVTFDRSNVLFNGNCTYILSRDVTMNEDGNHKYQVMVTNGACDEGICTEVITIFYDTHIVQIRKGNVPNQLITMVDDQLVDLYPFQAPWLVLAETANRDVQLLLPEIQLEIIAFKYNFAFMLRLPSHTFGGAMEGLCGNCNGRQNDDLKKHDGELTNDEQEFGNSWSVKNLSPTLNLNEEQCSSKPRKRCVDEPSANGYCEQLLQDVTFARCHGIVDPTPYYLGCKDALCEGGQACSQFEAYARMCTMGGVCIDWRTPQMCPYECAPHLEYQACGTGCAETCKTVETPIKCTADPVEGCFCPVDHVWQNGTCVHKRKCFACDDEGHVDGDVWQPDRCTQCSCNKRLIKCHHAECPAVETICDENSNPVMLPGTEHDCCPKYLCVPIPPKEPECVEMQQPECGFAQTLKVTVDSNGCQKFICQCVSEDQCSLYNNDVGMSSDLLEPGFVMITDTSGCCPKTSKVCKPETCPPAPDCQKFYRPVAIENPNACCVQYTCEPPKDVCLYSMDTSNDLEFTENFVAKQVGETWDDGKCKTCTCDYQDGLPTPRCVIKDCLRLENHPDINDYALEAMDVGECCPNFERVACRDNGNVYKVGEKWYPMSNDTCLMTECLLDINGLRKKTFTTMCTDTCELGYKYHESPDRSMSCCGECKPYACVVDGELFDINEVWYSDDHCVKTSCLETDGSLHVKSVSQTCEAVNLVEEMDYKVEAQIIPGQCCPKIVRTACRSDGMYYMPGESWKNPLDSCILESCIVTDEGLIVKQKETKTCNEGCPKGWEYTKSDPFACCGECKQVYCIVDDYLYEPGQIWYSNDNCTTYSCMEKSDQLIVTTSPPACPEINCDPELTYYDGCCQKCNLTHESKVEQTCVAEVFDFKETIGLISEKKIEHGYCKNLEPIEGLTECYGNCNSSTHFDTRTWEQVIDCSCCQPLDYRKIHVELTCEDGATFKKTLTVPTVCSCEACTGKKHPKHEGLKDMLKKFREERKMRGS